MAILECDSGPVADLLREAVDIVTAQGGYVSDQLILRQRESDLSLASTLPPVRHDTLIAVPYELLIPVAAFELRNIDDHIDYALKDQALPGATQRLGELTFELYNLLGKLAQTRSASPVFSFADSPDIARLLKPARAFTKEQWRVMDSGYGDNALLKLFLKTRTLRNAQASQESYAQALLPIIDFANHHTEAPGFQYGAKGHENMLSIANHKPVLGSDECHVRYSRRLDLLDTYLTYGFVDTMSRYRIVRAAAMDIEVEGFGSLEVHASAAPPFKGKLGDKNSDLREWLPMANRKAPDRMQLSHLLIPSGHSKRALRRVLALFLRQLKRDASVEQMKTGIESAERQVIDNTRDYYKRLTDAADNAEDTAAPEALDDLRTLCKLQRAHLDWYEKTALT